MRDLVDLIVVEEESDPHVSPTTPEGKVLNVTIVRIDAAQICKGSSAAAIAPVARAPRIPEQSRSEPSGALTPSWPIRRR